MFPKFGLACVLRSREILTCVHLTQLSNLVAHHKTQIECSKSLVTHSKSFSIASESLSRTWKLYQALFGTIAIQTLRPATATTVAPKACNPCIQSSNAQLRRTPCQKVHAPLTRNLDAEMDLAITEGIGRCGWTNLRRSSVRWMQA